MLSSVVRIYFEIGSRRGVNKAHQSRVTSPSTVPAPQDETHLPSQRFELVTPHILPIDLHDPFLRIVETTDQSGDSRLTRACWSNKRCKLSGLDVQIYIRERADNGLVTRNTRDRIRSRL